MTVDQGEARFPHFPSLLYKLIEHSATHYVSGVISVRIDRKRLGNTPFRREACVLKSLDEWKTENVSPPPFPCGNSAVSGGVYEQRHAAHRVLSQPAQQTR
jgi:hypothetical protein